MMKKLKRIYVAEEVHKRLKRLAVENDTTIQEVTRRLVKSPKETKGGLFDDIF